MDYKALLTKYAAYVHDAAATDFIESTRRMESDVKFTEAEWSELERINQQFNFTRRLGHAPTE